MPTLYDLEIPVPDGSTIGFMLERPEDEHGQIVVGAPRRFSDTISASASDEALSSDLHPLVWKNQGRGLGIDYNAAYCLDTRTAGYVHPFGAATGVTVQTGTHTTNTQLVAYAEYNGDLYIGQEGNGTTGGRVIKLTGGTGAISVSLSTPAGDDRIRDLLVADDGSGTTVLFATSESGTHANGRVHKFDGASWTSTATAGPAANYLGTTGKARMSYEYWTTADGLGGWRIVCITGPKTIAYTIPNGDPLLAASWVEGVKIGTSGSLVENANFRRHVYLGATDGLYDINELGESQEMTSYLRRMLQTGNGFAIEHLNSYVYMAVGRGLIRVYVGTATLSENPTEGQCAPGWGTPAEGDYRGYITALCVDQGYIVAAVHNPTVGKTFIFWGRDHNGTLSQYTKNPLEWHGPMVVFDADYKVNRMVTSGLAGDLRLWISSQSVAGATPRLDWVSLPIAGTPIDDLISGGTMKFCTGAVGVGNIVQPYCRLESMPDDDADHAIVKFPFLDSWGTRGPLDSNTKLSVDSRIDAAPGSTTWTSVGSVTASPSQDTTPPSTSGHKMQWRAQFFAPSGGASPPVIPVLESVRRQYFTTAPSFRVATFALQYGDGVPNNGQGEDSDRSPDDKTAQLKALTEGDAVEVRDRLDQRWTLKFRQVLAGGEKWIDNGRWHKRVTKTVQALVLAGPL